MKIILTFAVVSMMIVTSTEVNMDLIQWMFCNDSRVTELENVEKEKKIVSATECIEKKLSEKNDSLEIECNGIKKKLSPVYAIMFEDTEEVRKLFIIIISHLRLRISFQNLR
ncbi:hypothetical protein TNIN_473671 [Trichonephila inaurata madagascariensis]|uniref:Uncharacterized protein n=1 Tax=Trichonephila inaurata madagascariensis TaxID=2747483 RepID=A0A8X6WYN8_9ARAC|nr:hypothetical protein TNIN_473671 [Trichonephila inaurata madagascariensis]